jgi:pyrroloquinoline quinone biosynthesis protein B
MRVIVLGSGQATGFPAWNDGGPAALRARAGDPAVPRRAGAALAVSADGLRYSLLEAPLHLADTLTRVASLAPPAGSRAVPIDSLVLTSAELAACAGVLGFGPGLSLRIASSRELRAALVEGEGSTGFRSLAALWAGFPWDRAFPLDRDGRLEARLFPLPGPVPDFLRENAPRAGRGRCGIRITDLDTGLRLVWAPRLARLDSATLAELRAADLRFVDGTFYDDAEARRFRPGTARAEELGHLPIDGREGSLAWLAGMRGESIYIHLAGTNLLCDLKSEASERVRAAGAEIAFDGMEFER